MAQFSPLIDILNGREPTAPALATATDGDAFFALARDEGVALLIAEAAVQFPAIESWLGPGITPFARARHHALALEMLRRDSLGEVLEKLRPVRPLLLKGAALATQYYPEYHLRPMVDIDLLLAEDTVDMARTLLTEAGFEALPSVGGDLVMNQFICRRTIRPGLSLDLDVHTRLFNRPGMRDLLTWDEVDGSALPVPALGEHARAPCPAHLLAHACLHLLAHHAGDRKLVWLYDIKLLNDALDSDERARLLEFASNRRLAGVFARLLEETHAHVPLTRKDTLDTLAELASEQGQDVHPSSAGFIAPGRQQRIWQDWQQLGSFAARRRWLRQNLFPPAQYMVNRYQLPGKWMVPAAYLWRIARGSVRLFRTRR